MLRAHRYFPFRSFSSKKIPSNFDAYTVITDPSPRHIDIFMEAHGNSRSDFKREDLATWKNAWRDDYRFGLFFLKEDLVFSFNTIQYKSLGYQPDFKQLGMAWIPEKFRGKEILKVVTDYMKSHEDMMTRNMLACNVHWSQNFWRQATGNSDVRSCIYYISYYDIGDLRLPNLSMDGILVQKADETTIKDILQYSQKVFPFERTNWITALFTEGIGRIAYDTDGNVVGIGNVSIYPSGECVISPMYAEDKKVAQLLFQDILKEIFIRHCEEKRGLWRLQVRSNDQCLDSFEWIRPFLKCPLNRVHLSNLCYSIYPPRHFFDFSRVFVNCHPTNGPC